MIFYLILASVILVIATFYDFIDNLTVTKTGMILLYHILIMALGLSLVALLMELL